MKLFFILFLILAETATFGDLLHPEFHKRVPVLELHEHRQEALRLVGQRTVQPLADYTLDLSLLVPLPSGATGLLALNSPFSIEVGTLKIGGNLGTPEEGSFLGRDVVFYADSFVGIDGTKRFGGLCRVRWTDTDMRVTVHLAARGEDGYVHPLKIVPQPGNIFDANGNRIVDVNGNAVVLPGIRRGGVSGSLRIVFGADSGEREFSGSVLGGAFRRRLGTGKVPLFDGLVYHADGMAAFDSGLAALRVVSPSPHVLWSPLTTLKLQTLTRPGTAATCTVELSDGSRINPDPVGFAPGIFACKLALPPGRSSIRAWATDERGVHSPPLTIPVFVSARPHVWVGDTSSVDIDITSENRGNLLICGQGGSEFTGRLTLADGTFRFRGKWKDGITEISGDPTIQSPWSLRLMPIPGRDYDYLASFTRKSRDTSFPLYARTVASSGFQSERNVPVTLFTKAEDSSDDAPGGSAWAFGTLSEAGYFRLIGRTPDGLPFAIGASQRLADGEFECPVQGLEPGITAVFSLGLLSTPTQDRAFASYTIAGTFSWSRKGLPLLPDFIREDIVVGSEYIPRLAMSPGRWEFHGGMESEIWSTYDSGRFGRSGLLLGNRITMDLRFASGRISGRCENGDDLTGDVSGVLVTEFGKGGVSAAGYVEDRTGPQDFELNFPR